MLPRILWTAAIASAVAGLALRVIPTALPPPESVALSPAQALPSSPPAAYAGEGIVSANVFSPARVAPRVRFAPRGLAERPPAPRPPALTLYGITVTANGALALIDADPAIPGAELYRMGDLVRGARLIAITDSTVTLAQSSGPLTLHLAPRPRRKP